MAALSHLHANAASNEKLVRETLLTGPASAAHFVGLKNPAPAPEAGSADSGVDAHSGAVGLTS